MVIAQGTNSQTLPIDYIEDVHEILEAYKHYKQVYEQNKYINDKVYSPEVMFEAGLFYYDDETDGSGGKMKQIKHLRQAMAEGRPIKPENISLVPSHILLGGESPILPAPKLTEEQILRLEKSVDSEDLINRISNIMMDYKMDTYRGIALGQKYETSLKSANLKLMAAIQELSSEYSPLHGVLTSPDPDVRVWGARKAMQILEQAAVVYEKECLKRIEKLEPDVLRRKQQMEEMWHREVSGMTKNMYRTLSSPDQMMGMICLAAAAGPASVLLIALPMLVAMLESQRAHLQHQRLAKKALNTSHYIAREKANAMAIRIMGNMALPEIIIPLAAGESPVSVLSHVTKISDKYIELTNRLEEGLYNTLFQYETQKKTSRPLSPTEPQVVQLLQGLKSVAKGIYQEAYNPHLVYMSRQLKDSAQADWDIGTSCFTVDYFTKTDSVLSGSPGVADKLRLLSQAAKSRWSINKVFTVQLNSSLFEKNSFSVLGMDKLTRYRHTFMNYQETINRIANMITGVARTTKKNISPLAEVYNEIINNKQLYSSYMLKKTSAGLQKKPNADTIPALVTASLNAMKHSFERHAEELAQDIVQSMQNMQKKQGDTVDQTIVKNYLKSNYSSVMSSNLAHKVANIVVANQNDPKQMTQELKSCFMQTEDIDYLKQLKFAVSPIFTDMMMRIMPPEIWASISQLESLSSSIQKTDLSMVKSVIVAAMAKDIKQKFEERCGQGSLPVMMYDIMKGLAVQTLHKAGLDNVSSAIGKAAELLGKEGQELASMYQSLQKDLQSRDMDFVEGREEYILCQFCQQLCETDEEKMDISEAEKQHILSRAESEGVKILSDKRRKSAEENEADISRERVAVLAEQLSGAFNMTATSPLLQKLVQMHSVGFNYDRPVVMSDISKSSPKDREKEKEEYTAPDMVR